MPRRAISYGIPGFKYRGKGLAWYASFKAHCSFFPGGKAQNYSDELTGYKIPKGTIQLHPDKPIPPTSLLGSSGIAPQSSTPGGAE